MSDYRLQHQFGCAALFDNATAEIVSHDLLSPLFASLLFPDFLQQLLFWPVPTAPARSSMQSPHGLFKSLLDGQPTGDLEFDFTPCVRRRGFIIRACSRLDR